MGSKTAYVGSSLKKTMSDYGNQLIKSLYNKQGYLSLIDTNDQRSFGKRVNSTRATSPVFASTIAHGLSSGEEKPMEEPRLCLRENKSGNEVSKTDKVKTGSRQPR